MVKYAQLLSVDNSQMHLLRKVEDSIPCGDSETGFNRACEYFANAHKNVCAHGRT